MAVDLLSVPRVRDDVAAARWFGYAQDARSAYDHQTGGGARRGALLGLGSTATEVRA